ncbi:caspase recruitment domain-containing protein 19 isoform X3 [Peromyscus maniculatus bairdii]|uniref:caspase recruitment domain-containing protein 19 isoform X3 n=1 Tax=Peromyscus maniculatus bairdii TaxID=230844 RepID=UPI003FD0EDEB
MTDQTYCDRLVQDTPFLTGQGRLSEQQVDRIILQLNRYYPQILTNKEAEKVLRVPEPQGVPACAALRPPEPPSAAWGAALSGILPSALHPCPAPAQSPAQPLRPSTHELPGRPRPGRGPGPPPLLLPSRPQSAAGDASHPCLLARHH